MLSGRNLICFSGTAISEACSTERVLAKIPYTYKTNFGKCSQALTLLNTPQIKAVALTDFYFAYWKEEQLNFSQFSSILMARMRYAIH